MPALPVLLAHGFTPLVKQSQKVQVGQAIAQRIRPSEVIISVAEELQVPVHQVKLYLKKQPGDSVFPGDVIAEKKGFLGKSHAKIQGNITGIITHFEQESGSITIRLEYGKESGEETILSPIDGIILMSNNEKILIDTEKHVYIAKKGIGPAVADTLLYLDVDHTQPVLAHHLTMDAIGKIVIGTFFSKEVLLKSVSMGVAGIISTKLLDEDISYLQQKNITIPVVEIDQDSMILLKNWNDKQAFVNGEGKTIILLQK